MAISIKDPETDRLARELAKATGESITEAIRGALRERLERERQRRRSGGAGVAAGVRRIQERLARLPVRDPRPADQLLGYDEHGLPS
jgi:antitoxin VapB